MFVAQRSLLDLVAQGKLVRDLDVRELAEPEGVGFDLRVESLKNLSGEPGRLSLETRRTTPSVEKLADDDGYFRIVPHEYVLATTIEILEIPLDMVALFFVRSTLFRSGIVFGSSIGSPGYVGRMTFSLYNAGPVDFFLQRTSRFAHVAFAKIEGIASPYRGQWQGGRVSQPNDEKQI